VATCATLAGPALLVIAACSGGDNGAASRSNKQTASSPACVSTDTTPVGLAVREYITTATPTPQRYLSAAGTDSAVPEDGFKVLQDKGPTYYYGGDEKAKAAIRERLEVVGPYASLLVVYHGKTEANNGNAVTVSLGGHYIGGEHEGKVSPTRSIEIVCDTATGWKVGAVKTESGA